MTSLTWGAAALLLLAGCGVFQHAGAPEPSFNIDEDIQALEEVFGSATSIKDYYAGQATEARRNEFIAGRLTLINLQYIRFIRQFAVSKAQLDSAFDILTLGVDLAVTTVGGESAKTILGAISAGLTGSKVTIDKNFFQEKTVPALITAMNAQRKVALIPIIEGTSKPVDKYSFADAVTDLHEYYQAGTFVGALQAIQKDSGLKEAQAEADLRVVLDAKFGVDDNSTKIREFWKPGGVINPENRSKIDACMEETGLVTGPGTIGGLITGDTQADDRAAVVACLGI